MTTLPPSEITCPATATTQTACNQIPNATWIPSGSGGSGVCHCCKQDGTAYVDSNDQTVPCKACAGNATHCGDNSGFCNGSTGSMKVPCVQNSNTKRWAAQCGTTCEGPCGGSCGASEWFAFSKCVRNTSTGYNQCGFSISQWKSWLFYGLIFLLVLLFIIIIMIATRPKRPTAVYIPSSYTPVTTVVPPTVAQGMVRIQ